MACVNCILLSHLVSGSRKWCRLFLLHFLAAYFGFIIISGLIIYLQEGKAMATRAHSGEVLTC